MGEQKPFVFFLDTSNEYRERKEAFVTGHDGCSMSEVVAGLAPVTVSSARHNAALLCCKQPPLSASIWCKSDSRCRPGYSSIGWPCHTCPWLESPWCQYVHRASTSTRESDAAYTCVHVQIPLPMRFLFEFCVIVMPSLLSFTILADFSVHVALSQLGMVAMLHMMALLRYGKPLLSFTLRPDHALHVLAGECRKSFVSNFRSCMMIST
jgi:hypothetical protein